MSDDKKTEYYVSDMTRHPEGREWYAGLWRIWGVPTRCGSSRKPFVTFAGASRTMRRMNACAANRGWPTLYFVVVYHRGDLVKVDGPCSTEHSKPKCVPCDKCGKPNPLSAQQNLCPSCRADFLLELEAARRAERESADPKYRT